jgi:hypothetical protein
VKIISLFSAILPVLCEIPYGEFHEKKIVQPNSSVLSNFSKHFQYRKTGPKKIKHCQLFERAQTAKRNETNKNRVPDPDLHLAPDGFPSVHESEAVM